MVPLTALWLPILLAAVFVFIASSILHMVLPFHKSDYKKLPDEDATGNALRGIPPGLYMIPNCAGQKMDSPEVKEKFQRGPVAVITMMAPGAIQMPKFLGQWFVYCVLVSFFAAYITGRTVGTGTEYLQVFRVAGTAAFMAYSLAQIPNGIWGGQPWGNIFKHMFDGLIYALLTAGTFGWLWPRT